MKKIEVGKLERLHPSRLRQLAAVLGRVPATLHSSRDNQVFQPGRVDNARRNGVPTLEVLPDPERQIAPASCRCARRRSVTPSMGRWRRSP